jgi:hypothetical protein
MLTAAQPLAVTSVDRALQGVEFSASPFRYFLARRCLTPMLEQALLAWFEADAPWRLVETDFYEQYEFSLLDVALPASVSWLTSPESITALRRQMATMFVVDFEDRMTLVAHQLLPGQRIAIHNDYLEGEETHRLTVQLNRGLRDEDGGLFMLFNSFDAADVHRIIRPISGSGIGFEIGANSHHAVSRMHAGERYTLVYSFYAVHGV